MFQEFYSWFLDTHLEMLYKVYDISLGIPNKVFSFPGALNETFTWTSLTEWMLNTRYCFLYAQLLVSDYYNPMDSSPLGSGNFHEWKLEWVVISFSRGSSWPRDLHLLHWQVDSLSLSYLGSLCVCVCVCVCVCSCYLITRLCPTFCNPMDYSPPVSCVHGIFQKEYQSRLPFPYHGDFPHPGVKPMSPTLDGGFFTLNHQGALI